MDYLQQLTLLSTQPIFDETTPTSSQNAYLTLVQDLAAEASSLSTSLGASTSTSSRYIHPKVIAYPDKRGKEVYMKHRKITLESEFYSRYNEADTVGNGTWKMSSQFSLWLVRSCGQNFIKAHQAKLAASDKDDEDGKDKKNEKDEKDDNVDEEKDDNKDDNKKLEKQNTAVCILQNGAFIILDPMYTAQRAATYTRLSRVPGIAMVRALHKKLTDPQTPKVRGDKPGRGMSVKDIYYGPGLVDMTTRQGDVKSTNCVGISQQTIRIIVEGGFKVDTSGYKKLRL